MTDTTEQREARAREVLAEHLNSCTCFTTAENQWVERAAAIRAMLAFADSERASVGREAVEALRHALDRDRYVAAACVNAIDSVLRSRSWLREAGRGSYAYDDERYQQEFGLAFDEILEALRPMRAVARDKANCTTDPKKVKLARTAGAKAFAALQSPPAAKVEDAGAWQPIETAPRDGTIIDVWRDGTRETVRWGLPHHCCGEMGQYCDSDWHSIKQPGWVCETFGEFVGGEHDPFTHWMPLPSGPALAAHGAQS